MSSTQVDRSTKMGHITKKENEKSRKTFNASHKKHKHEDSRHFKFGRKRLQSFISNGKFFPPYKRRKKEGVIIPPTKFLLGGNIRDPLNLNSMQDEEINRAMNAVTPKSSPLPTPRHKTEVIEVIIPPNICDPLNLSNCNDNEEYEKQLISPTKKCSKRRNRKKKRASSGSGNDASDSTEIKTKDCDAIDIVQPMEQSVLDNIETEQQQPPLNTLPTNPSSQPKEAKPESSQKDKNKLRLKGLEEPKDKRLRKVDVKDKIVSPVIPQPGGWKTRPLHRPSQDKKKKQTMPRFREKDARYQYGNYNRYYGYRNSHNDMDTRLTVFVQYKYLFIDKDVLDIGCNIGHITLSVARDFSARSVTGIDIDRTLINIARKNIKHYVNCAQSPAGNEDSDHQDVNFFPISMPIVYGPVDIPGFTKNKSHRGFPYNVTFVQGNYVLEDDSLLCTEQPQFDTILCLSITKWIHLNFGDAGLKQAFRRMYAQLRPGGVLLLEPQSWSSYTKKKNLTERIYKNYESIEFRPHSFTQYLLSSEVGFSKCEVLSIPPHPSKGFQRPIHLFTKAGLSQERSDNSEKNATKQQEQEIEERRELEQEQQHEGRKELGQKRKDEESMELQEQQNDEKRRKLKEERKDEEGRELEQEQQHEGRRELGQKRKDEESMELHEQQNDEKRRKLKEERKDEERRELEQEQQHEGRRELGQKRKDEESMELQEQQNDEKRKKSEEERKDEERGELEQEQQHEGRRELGQKRKDEDSMELKEQRNDDITRKSEEERKDEERRELEQEQQHEGRRELGQKRKDEESMELQEQRNDEKRRKLEEERKDEERRELEQEQQDEGRRELGQKRKDEESMELQEQRNDDITRKSEEERKDEERRELEQEQQHEGRRELGQKRKDEESMELQEQRNDEKRRKLEEERKDEERKKFDDLT